MSNCQTREDGGRKKLLGNEEGERERESRGDVSIPPQQVSFSPGNLLWKATAARRRPAAGSLSIHLEMRELSSPKVAVTWHTSWIKDPFIVVTGQ